MKILLTGATGAIGKEIAKGLTANGHNVILACRSEWKAASLAYEIKAEYNTTPDTLMLDLADSKSVKEAAGKLSHVRLDGIIHNAGVMNGQYRTGPDGREDTMNVNYHNTRMLTELLLPTLNDGAGVVFTTSATRTWFPFQKITDDIPADCYGRLKAYALSKKLITRYAGHLSEELKGRDIRVNCTDPGVVDTPMLSMGKWFDPLTDIFFRPFCFKPRRAAKTAIRAVTSNRTGRIFLTPWGSEKIKV